MVAKALLEVCFVYRKPLTWLKERHDVMLAKDKELGADKKVLQAERMNLDNAEQIAVFLCERMRLLVTPRTPWEHRNTGAWHRRQTTIL